MKLESVVHAYIALGLLMETEMDYADAHALLMLYRKFRPHIDFYVSEEAKLVQQYAKKNEQGKAIIAENGGFCLEDPQKFAEYTNQKCALGNVEVEIEPVNIHAPKRISAKILDSLDGAVQFIKETAE